jgi:predicted ATPase
VGEGQHRLGPLGLPSSGSTAVEAEVFPAVQLFVERVSAIVEDFALTDANAPPVVEICRRLDGLPLAIEFAAPRVAVLGVEGLAAHLDDSLGLLGTRRRPAMPRHRTMRAVVDWSYGLLGEDEQLFFRALGIFTGGFTVEAATAVAMGPAKTHVDAIDRLADLVAKSLVVADVGGAKPRFRLLDTTRAHAIEMLDASGERERIARRHAEYYRDVFERAEDEATVRPTGEWLADYAREIDNLRAALDWAFSPGADGSVGVALATAAVPLWMHLSLMDECRSRVEQALAVIGAEPGRHATRAMKLYAALATSLVYAGGTQPELEAAWTNTLELAESLDDTEYRLRAVWELWTLNRVGRLHRAAMTQAQSFSTLAASRADPNHRLIGERMLGIWHHYLGDQVSARRHLEGVLEAYVESESRSHIIRFQVDLRVSACTFLAPVLWLLGFSDQAAQAAKAAIEHAQATNHALSVCHALVFGACPTALLSGDLVGAEHYVSMVIDHAERHGLARWHAYGCSYHGALLIKRGDVAGGLRRLRAGFDELGGFATLRFMDFLLPEALYRAGEISAGLAAVDEVIARSRETEEHRFIAELLRIKGELLLLQGESGAAARAGDLFREAVDWGRRQQTLSWELRAATSLARLLRDQHRSADAIACLRPVYGRFTEGFGTADPIAAKRLLDELRDAGRDPVTRDSGR